jgi:hypothetical protein
MLARLKAYPPPQGQVITECLQNALSSRGPQKRAVAAEAVALVAIQMDCFVVPLRATSRNDFLQARP